LSDTEREAKGRNRSAAKTAASSIRPTLLCRSAQLSVNDRAEKPRIIYFNDLHRERCIMCIIINHIPFGLSGATIEEGKRLAKIGYAITIAITMMTMKLLGENRLPIYF